MRCIIWESIVLPKTVRHNMCLSFPQLQSSISCGAAVYVDNGNWGPEGQTWELEPEVSAWAHAETRRALRGAWYHPNPPNKRSPRSLPWSTRIGKEIKLGSSSSITIGFPGRKRHQGRAGRLLKEDMSLWCAMGCPIKWCNVLHKIMSPPASLQSPGWLNRQTAIWQVSKILKHYCRHQKAQGYKKIPS